MVDMASTRMEKGQSSYLSLVIILFCTVILAMGLFFLASYSKKNTLISSSSEVDAPAVSAATGGLDEQSSLPDSTELSSEITTAELGLVMKLEDYQFTVAGTVDNYTSLQAITLAVNDTYGQYGRVNVKLNPGVESATWVDSAPDIVKNFTALIEGEMVLTNTSVALNGRAPNNESYKKLRNIIASDSFPSVSNEVEVTTLNSAEINVVSDGGSYRITGEMPSKSLVEQISASANQLFDSQRATVSISVNDTTSARLASIRFSEVMVGLVPFGDFDVRLDNDSFSLLLQDGLEIQGNDFSEESKRRISRLVFNAKITDHPIQIIASGGESSEEAAKRAQLFADVLSDNGVDSDRMIVRGQAESSRSASFIDPSNYSYEMVIEP